MRARQLGTAVCAAGLCAAAACADEPEVPHQPRGWSDFGPSHWPEPVRQGFAERTDEWFAFVRQPGLASRTGQARVHAVHPLQPLHVQATPGSMVLSDPGGVEWFRLSVVGVGRGQNEHWVEPVEPGFEDNKVWFRHTSFTEWYAMRPVGLEQAFVLSERPAGSAGEVVLRMSLDGDVEATMGDGAVRIRDSEHRTAWRVEYRDAFGVDSAGTSLPVEIVAPDARTLELRVQDRDARYPVYIDPLVIASQTLSTTLSDPSSAFGRAVDIWGDAIVVGDRYDGASSQGAIAFYKRDPGGVWAQTDSSRGSLSSEYAGWSVAINGTDVVAGSPGPDCTAQAARAFTWSGSVLTPIARVTAVEATSSCGRAADLGETWLALSGNSSVYIYRRTGNTWGSPVATISGATPSSIAVDGDRIAVGDVMFFNTIGPRGMARIVEWDGTTFPVIGQVSRTGGADGDRFGTAIALDGDVLAVGAPYSSPAGVGSAGAVYVFEFERVLAAWTLAQKIVEVAPALNDHFGRSLALEGDVLAIGSDAGSGTVSIYRRSGGEFLHDWDYRVPGVSSAGPLAMSQATLVVGDGDDGGQTSNRVVQVLKLSLSQGNACTIDAICATGHCVDGVCCEATCGGGATDDCVACAQAAGSEAASDGRCAALDVEGAAATTCRAAAPGCDAAEHCVAGSTTCPLDVVASADTQCRAAAGGCDVVESCDGVSGACPADEWRVTGDVCRAVAGGCDVAEECTGSSVDCPADAVRDAGETCRSSAGFCDVVERCDGVSSECPSDGFVAAATPCRDSAGACDLAEACTGSAAACPVDAKRGAGSECRASAGDCDPAETCDGVRSDCPVDGHAADGVVCRAAVDACDRAETCNGSAIACPADGLHPAGFICRVSADDCDVAETCDGVSVTCADNAIRPRCCAADSDCDDGDECTADSCDDDGRCGHTSIAACCANDASACNDGNACTVDRCDSVTRQCDHASIEGCADAGKPDPPPVHATRPRLPAGRGCACGVVARDPGGGHGWIGFGLAVAVFRRRRAGGKNR